MGEKHTYNVVIVDIEGTTTPISFVSDVLFPYIKQQLQNYLYSHWKQQQLVGDIRLLRDLVDEDKINNVEGVIEILDDSKSQEDIIDSVVKNVFWQMGKDRKSTALKNLQGHMWKIGYDNGELKSVVFDDVPEAFKKWGDLHIPVFIYSSGSIEAQKLLFAHTNAGNLLGFISDHFDTTTGPKVEATSYSKIAELMGFPNADSPPLVPEALFVTDSYLEAVAADKVGMGAVLMDRPGNKPLPEGNKFSVVKSFADLFNLYNFQHQNG